ncbi:MAG: tRNA (adenosine(37)-N6)-threonylcarbamoyltransferase complex dimerization subunit type 1 TsaB [Pseudomonadota bacterium]
MILGIDTSAGQCAVALAGPKGVDVRIEEMERGHAERLFPMIDEVTGGDYSQLIRIVVCTGPGSFTGLRIGVAAARGLALGCGIPVVGVSRFEALAFGKGTVTVVLRGRGESYYIQHFKTGAAAGEPVIGALPADGTLIGDGAPGATARNGLIKPKVLLEIGADRPVKLPPAPLYLRAAAADPPRDPPPVILDP